MATSWVTETKEKENYTKLCRLLYDGGTLAVRTVFDGICPPTSLATSLNSNIPILQRLRRPTGRVLSQDQWNLLYPPSGASPKSADFDITLLFVLLRNICSLTPPATGWDALPPSTDTSNEANLVRIKYYRNNVTAHSSKAEVDDTLFKKYWSDISDSLVSLGLKQDDIDELKSSPLGAKDYNQLVEYWDLSDQQIKQHLEAIKTDTLEIKTDIAHLKSKLSNMEKTFTQVKSEIAKLAHIDLTIMKDTSKIKTDTSEIKTYTSQIKKKTSKIKKKPSKIKKNTEIRPDTSKIKKKTSEIKTDTSKIKKKPSKIKKKTSEIKTDTSEKTCTQVESEIAKLAHIAFSTLIQKSCKLYHQSTRQWIFNQVEETVQKATSEASVVLIRAGAGMGKSIVAAKICDIYKKRGFLGGCHFFQHSNSERNNPRMMLQSIARQLCDSLTGYQAALEAKLKTTQGRNISDLNCEELFGVLFEEPLSQICVDHNVVIVIDALDECASKFKEEIEEVLKRKLSDLPLWIQFVITTRPLPSCCNLSPVVQIEIDPSDSRNEQDLREFFTFQLDQRNAKHLIDQLMEISKGLFLVAYFVVKILDENGHESVADVLKRFPLGISSVYEHYVKRIHELVKPYIHQSENEDESFFKMLEAMVAAKSPIPKKMFYEILCLKNLEEDVQRDQRKERNDAVHLLHTIFPVENDHVSVFHKSVTDWLNLDGENIHQFSVSASNGCEVLAQNSLDVLKAFKKAVEDKEKPFDQPLVLSDSERFALRFGLEYVNKSSKPSQTEKDEIIKDFIIMAAILSTFNDNQSDIFDSLYGRFSYFFYLMADCVCSYNFTSVFPNRKQFEEIDFDNKKVSFGQFLSIVGDVILTEDILPTDQKQKLLSLCIEYKLPYYSLHPVVSSLPSAFQHQSSSSFFDLFDITNGFIAVNVDPVSEPPTSTVLNIKDDGSFGEDKTFVSSDVRGVSPDKKFLIITKTNTSKLELFDVTTLEKVREYNCPINCVDSCHIFGDEQWYIVVKAECDSKIHILDGLNGQLHDTIEVGEDEKIEGVSQCGHILISHNIVKSTTVEDDDDDEEDDDEEDKDDDDDDEEEEDDDFNDDDTLKDEILFLKTIHFRNRDVKIYYYPPEIDNLHDGGWKKDLLNENFKFSDDGKYFSLYINRKVYIFHTNDGTLYRIVKNYTDFSRREIHVVFLSFSCLVVRYLFIIDHSVLMFYDLLNSKLIYTAPMKLTDQSRLLVPPQHHTDESIPTTLFELTDYKLVKYEFHNLE